MHIKSEKYYSKINCDHQISYEFNLSFIFPLIVEWILIRHGKRRWHSSIVSIGGFQVLYTCLKYLGIFEDAYKSKDLTRVHLWMALCYLSLWALCNHQHACGISKCARGDINRIFSGLCSLHLDGERIPTLTSIVYVKLNTFNRFSFWKVHIQIKSLDMDTNW